MLFPNLNSLTTKSLARASKWQMLSNKISRKQNSEFKSKMQTMLKNEDAKHLFIELIDRCFRPKNPKLIAQNIIDTLNKYENTNLFSKSESALILLFRVIGRYFPGISVPLIIEKIRADTKSVIIEAEEKEIKQFIKNNKHSETRLNFNLIGETILSEQEAQNKITAYCELINKTYIDYISIKISNLYSQINCFAFNETLEIIKARIQIIYKESAKQCPPTFINLDMEEYRDLELTVTAFKQVLDLPEFKSYTAGIVLQAYIPESYTYLENLCAWSKARVNNGGNPIKVRIVKGANMEMELIEASTKNWETATYSNKIDTDANYKKMILLAYNNSAYINIGIASHNIFEMAFAYEAALEHEIADKIEFELLQGMADSNLEVLQNLNIKVLIYVPIVKKTDFLNAIAYLVRRLDENTAEQNFLRYSFNLKVNSDDWLFLKELFIESIHKMESLCNRTNRNQNRQNSTLEPAVSKKFQNTTDTDWTRENNREWASTIRDKWSVKNNFKIPVIVANSTYFDNLKSSEVFDKSLQHKIGSFALANTEIIDIAIKTAKCDIDNWNTISQAKITEILSQVAVNIENTRADFIGAASAETGKIFTETDAEVSEAIDFANYYPKTVEFFITQTSYKPKGVGVVISPWNFPIAIPIGGIVAALATGNNVIFKPSSSAALCGYLLCKCFWDAGISKNTLQFVPCNTSSLVNNPLIDPEKIDFVIFTGGTDTALSFKKQHPTLNLFAETGGKNSTIVTENADKEQAIKNIIHSAYSNNGQKCSATSLVLLQNQLYNSPEFKQSLVEAVKSLKVGSTWDFDTQISPLTNPPSGNLAKAININEGNWLLKPFIDSENKNLVHPGILWDVKPIDFSYLNELFGPIISVMSFTTLAEAIILTNETGFGLTAGIETLNKDEEFEWLNNINAGNLYINRSTTGAIVQRQPFGGYGWSSFGSGLKAGGPNYVSNFMNFEKSLLLKEKSNSRVPDYMVNCIASIKNTLKEKDIKLFENTINSYVNWYKKYFLKFHDLSNIRGETNHLIYLPIQDLAIVVYPNDNLFDIACKIISAELIGENYSIIICTDCELLFTIQKFDLVYGDIILDIEDDFYNEIQFIEHLLISPETILPLKYLQKTVEHNCTIYNNKVTGNGRIDLLPFLREQSISNRFHRYGNLGKQKVK